MKVRNSILIRSRCEVVWRVTIDLERWPEWSPTFDSVRRIDEGPFNLGSSALVKQPGQRETVWTVTKLIPEREFSWETTVASVRMIATHRIIEKSHNTHSNLELELVGIAARVLWPLIRRNISRALARENQGLKDECESIAGVLTT